MSAQRIKRVERQPFAVKDAAGKEHHCIVNYPILEVRMADGSTSEERGVRNAEIKTSDGHDLNKTGTGRYELAQDPSVVFTSDDPNAP
jgi:hypothetical protein